MSKYTLIIDQGGHSTRALVFNQKGEPIAYSSEPVDQALETPSPDHVEYNIDAIIDSTRQLLQRLFQQLSHKKILKITSAAIIAQRSSIVACDKNGIALTEMISWQDTRNAAWLAQQNFNQHELQAITGLRNNPHMGASKIRWLLDHDTNIQEHAKTQNLMFMPWGAYFLQRLKQLSKKDDTKNESQEPIEFVTDPILAARTGLVAYQEYDWSEKLLALYGLQTYYFPKIVSSSYHYGEIKLNGIHIPIQLLGGDQNFIPCAYGNRHITDTIYLNIGTGAFLQAHAKQKEQHALLKTTIAQEKVAADAPSNSTTNNGKARNVSIIEGTVNAAATALDWWQTQLPRPFSYTEIDQIIEQNSIAPLFINTLSGTGSPYWLATKEPVFLNIGDEQHSEAEKTLAVIESILFSCKLNIDIILKQNCDVKIIIISGGLSRSDAICQLLADITDINITRYNDSEASARGALFYLLNKEEYHPKNESRLFSPRRRAKNEIEKVEQHLKRFDHYKAHMETLGHSNSLSD